jgi:hypothetical protein
MERWCSVTGVISRRVERRFTEADPELLWPQAATELRSAWTGEGARPHTNGAATEDTEGTGDGGVFR